MRTFAIVNLKGGVGKTITAYNMACIMAMERGRRVLLIDADGQANTTGMLLPKGDYPGVGALLRGEVSFYEDAIEKTAIPNLDLIPADTSLWAVDLACMLSGGKAIFGNLQDVRDCVIEDDAYDAIIIDCPPSFSAACISAIAAADSIIIPVLADAFSAEGLSELVKQIDLVRQVHPSIRISGCLLMQYHRAEVVLQAEDYLRRQSPVAVYSTVIRRTDKVGEHLGKGAPAGVVTPQLRRPGLPPVRG